MKKIIGCYNKSVYLTYIGMLLSLFGIMYLLNNVEMESINRFDIAMVCLIIAGICDLFDGVIARKCKRNDLEKAFGVQIDTLVDIVSFLAFPSVMLVMFNKVTYGEMWFTYVIVMFYVLCGVIRLAWFNIHVNGERTKYYTGLPVTYIALIIPIFYALTKFAKINIFTVGLNIILVVVGILFVLNVKIKKPTGIWYLIFSLLAVATILGILIF